MNNINIPKPPTRGNKTTDEYLAEMERWANKMYDALRYMCESGGNRNNDNL